MNSSFSGSKRKFPAVVGGPGDVHTTRSTIYTRTDGNSRENLKQSVKDVPAGVPADVPAGVPADVPAGVPADVPAGVLTGVPAGVPVSAGIPAGAPTDISAGIPAGAPAQETVMDYASLPDLDGAPRVGDMIAFKVPNFSLAPQNG